MIRLLRFQLTALALYPAMGCTAPGPRTPAAACVMYVTRNSYVCIESCHERVATFVYKCEVHCKCEGKSSTNKVDTAVHLPALGLRAGTPARAGGVWRAVSISEKHATIFPRRRSAHASRPRAECRAADDAAPRLRLRGLTCTAYHLRSRGCVSVAAARPILADCQC